jgi:DNA-binding MarR family transcriptional regulator
MAHSNKDKPPAGRFSYEGLDRVIHERARLSILTSLIANKRGLLFGDLKRLCALSDGNLSRHLQVLVGAKLVSMSKGFENNRPQTVCRITALGRARYLEYVEVLEQVVRDASEGMSEQPRAIAQRLAPA